VKAREIVRCAICGRLLRMAYYGRPRHYCGAACKQAAYRTRADGLQSACTDVGHVKYGVTKLRALRACSEVSMSNMRTLVDTIDTVGRELAPLRGEVLPPAPVIRIPSAPDPPAAVFHESREARRDPALESEVYVPALQTIFTALAFGVAAGLLAWAAGWSWRVPVVAAAVGLAFGWAWRLRLADRLLWQIEFWADSDLNGDGATGRPVMSFCLANPGQARQIIAAETRQSVDEEKRAALLRFVDTCFVRGTSESAQGVAAGDRADYVRMRDVLLSLGIAAWKNPQRPKAGWLMAVSRQRARQTIERHVL